MPRPLQHEGLPALATAPSRWLGAAVVMACLAWRALFPQVSAATLPATPYPNDVVIRYAIVIDLAAEMKPRMDFVRKTVVDLWLNGVGGLAKTGDTMGMWTFRDQVDRTNFPVHVWVPSIRQDLAVRADVHLQKLRPSKKSQLVVALSELINASRRSGVITGIILTDGLKPVRGTPFDDRINAIFQQHALEMKEAKRPFAVALLARNGEWIAWAVSAGGGKLDIPFLPEEYALASAQKDALFNKPEAPKPAPPPTPKPKPRGAPLIITEPKPITPPAAEPVAAAPKPAPQVAAAPPPQPEAPVAPPPSQPPQVATLPQTVIPSPPLPQPSTAQATQPVPASPSPGPNPVVDPAAGKPGPSTTAPSTQASQPPPPAGSNSNPPEPRRAPSAPAETAVPSAPVPIIQTEAPTPVESPHVDVPPAGDRSTTNASDQTPDPVTTAVIAQANPRRQLVIALVLLAAASGVALLFIRSRRPPPEPSLISQSFDRERH